MEPCKLWVLTPEPTCSVPEDWASELVADCWSGSTSSASDCWPALLSLAPAAADLAAFLWCCPLILQALLASARCSWALGHSSTGPGVVAAFRGPVQVATDTHQHVPRMARQQRLCCRASVPDAHVHAHANLLCQTRRWHRAQEQGTRAHLGSCASAFLGALPRLPIPLQQTEVSDTMFGAAKAISCAVRCWVLRQQEQVCLCSRPSGSRSCKQPSTAGSGARGRQDTSQGPPAQHQLLLALARQLGARA